MMTEEFYNCLFRKLTLQIWLAMGVMAILSVLLAVSLSRIITSNDLHYLRLSIEASRCNCKGTITNENHTNIERTPSLNELAISLAKERDKGKSSHDMRRDSNSN